MDNAIEMQKYAKIKNLLRDLSGNYVSRTREEVLEKYTERLIDSKYSINAIAKGVLAIQESDLERFPTLRDLKNSVRTFLNTERDTKHTFYFETAERQRNEAREIYKNLIEKVKLTPGQIKKYHEFYCKKVFGENFFNLAKDICDIDVTEFMRISLKDLRDANMDSKRAIAIGIKRKQEEIEKSQRRSFGEAS